MIHHPQYIDSYDQLINDPPIHNPLIHNPLILDSWVKPTTAEDETTIIGKCVIGIGKERDQVWRCCGRSSDDHQCDPAFAHVIGDIDEFYRTLLDAFKSNQVATYARVFMVDPIHNDNPFFILLLCGNCNTFTHADVSFEGMF